MGTHEVFNQPPPLEDYDLYGTDPVLADAVAREGGAWADEDLHAFGRLAGSAETYALGARANTHEPVLRTHDRFGHRIDEVTFD
ncbi:MAG: DNA alkylation response protein, partial [Acidimicrobiales bacterium]